MNNVTLLVTLAFFENIQQYKPELDSLLPHHFHLLNATSDLGCR